MSDVLSDTLMVFDLRVLVDGSLKKDDGKYLWGLKTKEAISIANRIESLRSQLDQITKKHDELITANGVRVIPGDVVFHPDWDEYLPDIEVWAEHQFAENFYGDAMKKWCDSFEDDLPKYLAAATYYEEDTGAGDGIIATVSECYSTRELAEAARERDTTNHRDGEEGRK